MHKTPSLDQGLIALKMKHRQLRLFIFLISLSVASHPTHAEESAGLGAHVHGLSTLTIAMERENIEIQLTSPAMDLVGFEYKARSAKDIAIVENASLTLREHQGLFVVTGGECDHLNTMVDIANLVETDRDDHEHDHEDHTDSGQHHEIVANYTYRCEKLDALSSINVFLFQKFPGIQSIQVMWVGPAKQGAVALTPNDSLIEFK